MAQVERAKQMIYSPEEELQVNNVPPQFLKRFQIQMLLVLEISNQ